MTHRPEIDGLRAIAVLAVIFFHARLGVVPGGFLGVDVFFVISGYLITQVLVNDLGGTFANLVQFYERRVRRIVPVFFVVVMCAVAAAWWILPTRQMLDFGRSVAAASVFGSNILFWRSSGYFDLGAEERPLLHTWSLGVEEQFYVLFPVLLCWLLRYDRRRARLVIFAVLTASFVLALTQWQDRASATFYLLPTRAWELLAGASVALLPPVCANVIEVRTREWTCILALIVLCGALLANVPQPGVPPWWQLVPVGATALLLALVPSGGLVARLLGSRLLVSIGLVSYSAYLWHHPLFDFARMFSLRPLGHGVSAGLIVLTFALSAVSWRYIEKPTRRRNFGTTRAVYVYGGLASLILVVCGLVLSQPGSVNDARLSDRVRAEELAIQAQVESRQRSILSGTCSFNGQYGLHKVFANYIAAWDCWGAGSPRRVVVGDSHAADIAVALRSQGMEVGQMTGAGCSLVPSLMSTDCRRQFDLVRRGAAGQGVNTLILANRYDPVELTDAARSEMADYWSLPGVELWLFTGLPELPDLTLLRPRALVLGLHLDSIRPNPADSLPSEVFFDELSRVLPSARVFNTRSLFCAIDPGHRCAWRASGQDFLIDGHHFTVAGAALFGRQIVEVLRAEVSN